MTDLPKISDEIERVILRGLIDRRVEVEGPDFDYADSHLIAYARSVRTALERAGYRREADVLRPVTWQEPGKLPAAFHQHRCGAVEWWPMEGADSGGCDACESGNDDPRDWRMLYAADWPATALEPPLPLPVADGREVEQGQERSEGQRHG